MAEKLPTGRTGESVVTSPKLSARKETVLEYFGDSRTGAEKIAQSGPIYPIAGRRQGPPVVEVGMAGPIPGQKKKQMKGKHGAKTKKAGKTTKKGVYGKQKSHNPGY